MTAPKANAVKGAPPKVVPVALPLSGALCAGMPLLFESARSDDHERAAALCAVCPAFDACASNRDQLLAERHKLEGTWAGASATPALAVRAHLDAVGRTIFDLVKRGTLTRAVAKVRCPGGGRGPCLSCDHKALLVGEQLFRGYLECA